MPWPLGYCNQGMVYSYRWGTSIRLLVAQWIMVVLRLLELASIFRLYVTVAFIIGKRTCPQ